MRQRPLYPGDRAVGTRRAHIECWHPHRSFADDPLQCSLRPAAAHQPVRNVALRRAIRPVLGQIDDAHLGRGPMERRRDGADVRTSGIVLVAEDNDFRSPQGRAVERKPFAGAAGVRRGGYADFVQRVSIALALDYADQPIFFDGLDHLGQAIEDAPRAIHFPGLAANRIPLPLTKRFRLIPHDLIKQNPGFVGIVVGRYFPQCLPQCLPSRIGSSRGQSLAHQPAERSGFIAIQRVANEIDRPPANARLMIEPKAASEIDGPGTVCSPAQVITL
jgi:hypothetical protein